MTTSPSLVAAATGLAEWAHARRRGWSDLPLAFPRAAEAAPLPIVQTIDVFENPVAPLAVEAVDARETAEATDVVLRPTAPAVVRAGLKAGTTMAGRLLVSSFERLHRLREPAAVWLMRGAALVSTMSVVMVIGVNRGVILARWDRASAFAVEAARRVVPPPPQPPATPQRGTGRLTLAVSDGTAHVLVDGTPRGVAPLTIDLPAGAHRVMLTSPSGSVERIVHVRAGESSELTEAIFPGWVVLTTPIELAMSEGGQPLKRDERGWAILPPGPHDIQLDSGAFGVHELRRVVVTPGDTTRLSFMPHASTISLTTNEAADVWIDGVSSGQAPLVGQPISVGAHDIRVRSASHERWLRVRATVEPLQINVDLTAGR